MSNNFINFPLGLVEQVEAEAYHAFQEHTPARTRAALGMDALRIGGGVVLSMREDPTRFWSKVLGLGFEEPVTAELIGEICDFYRSSGTPIAIFQLAPSVLPPDWPEICAKCGLTAGGVLAKLVGDVDAALLAVRSETRPAPTVRVEPALPGDAARWASVMLDCFGMPREHLSDMAASSIGTRGWHHVAAWDGPELVGTAGLYVHREAGHMFGGAMLPQARRRGGQSALLAARVQAAQEAGCRWIVGETSVEAPGSHNSSLHNMLRAGMSVRYERQNWIWRGRQTG